MSKEELEHKPQSRGYSPTHEKVIPIAIGILVVIAIGMLILAAAIALGWIPTG